MESSLHVQVALDEKLTQAQTNAVRAAAQSRPNLCLDEAVTDACTITWVVYQLDASTLAMLEAACQHATSPVLVLACCPPEPEQSLQALTTGVRDVLCGESFDVLFDDILVRASRDAEIEAILRSPLVQEHLTGNSRNWVATLRELIAAARFSDAPILLLGETGTGKELLARLAHTLDRRPDKRDLFVVDCTTLTPELAGSELFGHERGAFTGSVGARRGAIAEANQGTLFLDEVAELPLEVQAKLLRTLQEGTYKPVGSDQWRQARFRFVCATHRDLTAAVQSGCFRADLYFRIASCVLLVPPLRERHGDVRVLADAFLREFGCSAGADDTVHRVLERHAFPGNVRELRQLMQSAAQTHGGQAAVSVGCLPRAWRERLDVVSEAAVEVSGANLALDPERVMGSWLDEGLGLQAITQRAGDLAIQVALSLEGNHLGRAAGRLGVTERAIQLRRSRRASANGGESR